MQLDPQKNFYDRRRYFQGKDNPDDAHPDPNAAREPLPRSQIVFGLIFFAVMAALFWLRIKAENGPAPSTILRPAPAAAAAPPAKK
jgi:hypothetical protein